MGYFGGCLGALTAFVALLYPPTLALQSPCYRSGFSPSSSSCHLSTPASRSSKRTTPPRSLLIRKALRSLSSAKSTPSGKIHLDRGKARLFYEGNPIVYPGAINREEGLPSSKELSAGHVVDVVDHRGNGIGWGVYNPHSLYRVRMLSFKNGKGEELLEEGTRQRIGGAVANAVSEAIEIRKSLGLPNSKSSSYRLLNGEGDGVSGLSVDVFDPVSEQGESGQDNPLPAPVAVVMSTAYWIEQYRPEVQAAISKALPSGTRLLWRRQETALRKDGWNITSNEKAVEIDGDNSEDQQLRFLIKENGLKFWVDLTGGQKTGYYLDQRENRRVIEELGRDKDVLDLFCYSGGFSIHAAAGGAKKVLGIDSSANAISLARENADLNGFGGFVEFRQQDVFKFLEEHEQEDKYDLVICDPPKFAPSRRDLPKATRRYIRLNVAAMKRVRPGGLLLSCTCSGAMTQTRDAFIRMLKDAANEAGRRITVIESHHAGRDHLVRLSYPEGQYLTAVLLAVQ